MLLALIITLQLSTGDVLVAKKQPWTSKQQPFRMLHNCQKYAKDMEKRLQKTISTNDYLKHVTVECKRLPLSEIITNYQAKNNRKLRK